MLEAKLLSVIQGHAQRQLQALHLHNDYTTSFKTSATHQTLPVRLPQRLHNALFGKELPEVP